MMMSRSATHNVACTPSYSQLSLCEQTLVNATNNSNQRHDEPANWLLPTASRAPRPPASRLREPPIKPSNTRAPGQRQVLRAASELGGKSGRLSSSGAYYVQNDTGAKNAAPTYLLNDPSGKEEPRESTDHYGGCGPARSFTKIRSDRGPASAQRQRSPAPTGRPGLQHQSPANGNRVCGAAQSAAADRKRSLQSSAQLRSKLSRVGDAQRATTTRPVRRQIRKEVSISNF